MYESPSWWYLFIWTLLRIENAHATAKTVKPAGSDHAGAAAHVPTPRSMSRVPSHMGTSSVSAPGTGARQGGDAGSDGLQTRLRSPNTEESEV